MLYKECVNCGRFSDDGANLQKNGVTIHLCPDCCDISDKEKDKLFEKFKPVPTIEKAPSFKAKG